jgi:hypothetical protein
MWGAIVMNQKPQSMVHTEIWEVLDSKYEAIGRRLILLVDQDL